jgi:hypothetical protein
MTTSTPTRRDNLHEVYMFVVHNWAVDRADINSHLPHFTKEQLNSLLSTLRNKRLIVGEQVNGEGMLVWQSYHDIENEKDAEKDAEADFAATFPNEVKEGKTPTQVAKSRPAEGAVIYEVRKTRTTGAHVTLTNYSTGTGERRYVATCKTHGTEHAFKKRLPAESMCHHPEEWCEDCQVIDTTNQHQALQEAGI